MESREEFLTLVKSISRDGIDQLVEYLESSDFFTAPASTTYHKNNQGGLCEHSLNVYHNMIKLRDLYCPEMPDDTVKVTALFHDLAKIGFYEKYSQNKKVYSPTGSKSDELGRFDWVATTSYKIKDASDRDLICGEHGVNSFYILNKYIKLTDGEAVAIINHHAGKDNGYVFRDLNEAFNRYPTLLLLHLADMTTTYVTENPYFIE